MLKKSLSIPTFKTRGKKQIFCQSCESTFNSDEGLSIHIKEFHTEKKAEEIKSEKSFDLYVETSLPNIFDIYLANNRHVKCYFCDFISKSQILKNISDEVSDHMEEIHGEISAAFDPHNFNFINDLHHEFLEFGSIIMITIP